MHLLRTSCSWWVLRSAECQDLRFRSLPKSCRPSRRLRAAPAAPQGRAYLRIGSRCIVKYADGILAQEHEVVDCIEHASFLARDFKSISLCLR